MEFDITGIDKILLIQALFAHASPRGLGKFEYNFRKKIGDTVDGLTQSECELILYEFYNSNERFLKILDYHKGKPMKLVFEKTKTGRVLADTDSYDARNGKYRFFEALLNTFLLDEIRITKKGYSPFILRELPHNLRRTKEEESVFKTLLKGSIKVENQSVKYWLLDEKAVPVYTPTYMQ